MFWKNEYQPSILGCKLNDEELQQFLVENDIGLQIVDNSTRWCAFAQCYALHHDFNVVKATSFSYMVSLFMTGMGISASTEMYYKEEKIEFAVIDAMNDIQNRDLPEEEQVKMTFDFIFNLYTNDIYRYEHAIERLSFRLTLSEMEKFQAIKGKNNKEKFKKLIGDKMYTVSDNIHSKDLVKLGFPKNLCTSPESCEILLEHCKKYDMKFLKGSYGTLVHNDFNKYFKVSQNNKIEDLLKCKDILIDGEPLNLPLDHIKLFKSKIEDDVYILTSSPYDSLNRNMFNRIKDYPYSVYIVHPNFLDYISFVDMGPVGALRQPIENINYAFTNASPEQMLNINKVIYDNLDLNNFVFEFLSEGDVK